MSPHTALFFDCETTGPPWDIPVQIAYAVTTAVTTAGWSAGGPDYRTLSFHPGILIPAGAMAVHHITDAAVEHYEPWPGSWLPEPSPDYLVAHNVDYDWRAIGAPEIPRIDTLAIARILWPESPNHKLTTLCYYVTDRQEHANLAAWLCWAHRSVTDLQALCYIWSHITEHPDTQHLETWPEWWAYSEQCRVPRVMPFGKHRGLPLAQVPPDYRAWLLGTADLDSYLRRALVAL